LAPTAQATPAPKPRSPLKRVEPDFVEYPLPLEAERDRQGVNVLDEEGTPEFAGLVYVYVTAAALLGVEGWLAAPSWR
jgi:hypothetical protein